MSNEYKYEPIEQSSTSPSTMIDMIRLPHHDIKNPFAFTIQQLTSLVDRKDLEFLQQLFGVEGLARGLHSHLSLGIQENELDLPSINIDQIEQQQKQQEKEKDEKDENNNDEIDNDFNSDTTTPIFTNVTSTTTSPLCSPRFVQRKYVYGSNILPDINSNSLLQLMWNAFQDKTLVKINK